MGRRIARRSLRRAVRRGFTRRSLIRGGLQRSNLSTAKPFTPLLTVRNAGTAVTGGAGVAHASQQSRVTLHFERRRAREGSQMQGMESGARVRCGERGQAWGNGSGVSLGRRGILLGKLLVHFGHVEALHGFDDLVEGRSGQRTRL